MSPPNCCIYCKNPNGIGAICKNSHCICNDCQAAFPNCPLCAEQWLPQSDFFLDSLLPPLYLGDEREGVATIGGMTGHNDRVLNKLVVPKKKSPVEKVEESFFLGIWDALASFMFAQKKRDETGKDLFAKVVSRIAKRMGKPLLSLMSISRNNSTSHSTSAVLPVSLTLLCLLLGLHYMTRDKPLSIKPAVSHR